MKNLIIYKIAFGLPALLLCFSGLSAQVSVAVVFDRANIETGDTFTMRVVVSGTNAKPDRVDFNAWKDVLPSENILRRSAWEQAAGKWVSEYTLIVFDAYDSQLPPITVLSLAGEPALSNPVPLKITATPSPNEVEKMEPVRDIRHEPFLWTDAMLLLGILLLLYVAYRYFTKKKKVAPVQVVQAPVAAPEPPQAPHVIALQRLKKLEQQKPWKSDIKGYYADLSHILKEYTEARFQVPALESTTREVEILLKKTALKEGLILTLVNVLRQTDLAKYAQALDPDKPHESYLLKAEEFVTKSAGETI